LHWRVVARHLQLLLIKSAQVERMYDATSLVTRRLHLHFHFQTPFSHIAQAAL
jgi:hypothetical protein